MAQTWFGGAFEEAGRVTFPNFAVEPDQVAAVYPDYPIAADFPALPRRRLARRQVMRKYEDGEHIALRSTAWPVNLDLPDRW